VTEASPRRTLADDLNYTYARNEFMGIRDRLDQGVSCRPGTNDLATPLTLQDFEHAINNLLADNFEPTTLYINPKFGARMVIGQIIWTLRAHCVRRIRFERRRSRITREYAVQLQQALSRIT
jgi:hypothetical protein